MSGGVGGAGESPAPTRLAAPQPRWARRSRARAGVSPTNRFALGEDRTGALICEDRGTTLVRDKRRRPASDLRFHGCSTFSPDRAGLGRCCLGSRC